MTSLDLETSVEIINYSAENISDLTEFSSITNAFRFLRNLCATNADIQNKIVQEYNILTSTKTILNKILTCEQVIDDQVLCLTVGLQLIGNAVVNNKNNQKQVWAVCQDIFEKFLKYQHDKVQNCCAMIIYNICLGSPEILCDLRHPFEDLYSLTMKENTAEFATYILEIFVSKSDYLNSFYNELKPESRIILMEIIRDIIKEENNQELQPDIVKFFSNEFTKKSDLILKTCESYVNSLDPVEIVKILELLNDFSSNDKQIYLVILQQETSLLINCIELLKNIHTLSKQSGNEFSMKLNITDTKENKNSIQEHPAFGFKGALIRLIGNFCWKNPSNQNLVRELECIPVILDCCRIDDNNPFIMQWSIFAIRNVLEKNSENQSTIASLSKEGKIDAATLNQLGITLNVDGKGDSICIAPLKK